jgi:hypothetical protein
MLSFKTQKDVKKKEGTLSVRLQIFRGRLKFINLDILGDAEY